MSENGHALTVGLVQMCVPFWVHRKREQFMVKDGQVVPRPVFNPEETTDFVFVPYSVGLLQAYCQKYASDPSRFTFLQPIFNRISVEEAVKHLDSADVVAFSAYIWNARLSLRMASALKKRFPNCLIVFGGPQVPDTPDDFLRENPQVDIVCHGEGERVFLEILEHAVDRCWDSIPAVSYLQDGKVVTHPRALRNHDLSSLPSPYLKGVFDELLRNNTDKRWAVLWETNRGCPFSCTFCDWGSAVSSKVYKFDDDRVKTEIEWFAERKFPYIWIVDANFGIFPRDVEIAKQLTDAYRKRRAYFGIARWDSKNASERSYQIHKIFTKGRAATIGATLSLQSVDQNTLKIIRRDNISLASYNELQQQYIRDGLKSYTDLIVGLPGDTYDSLANGAETVIANGQHYRINFFSCSILPNAEMGDPNYQKLHGMEYVSARIIQDFETLEATAKDEPEYINIVVATKTMPREDWVRARSFGWITELLHCDRLLQVVLLVLGEGYGISYRQMIEAILEADPEQYPVCAALGGLFYNQARAMQVGKPEFIPSQEFCGTWWRPDLYALVKLVADGKCDAFYAEATDILKNLLLAKRSDADLELLHDAIELNGWMLRVPQRLKDAEVSLSYNVLEFYEGVVNGSRVPLSKGCFSYVVDCTSTVWLSTEAWCEEVLTQIYRQDMFLYSARVNPTKEFVSAS
jgi:radical SAM superfamily enzyme YgiQ (UPF0313 family)